MLNTHTEAPEYISDVPHLTIAQIASWGACGPGQNSVRRVFPSGKVPLTVTSALQLYDSGVDWQWMFNLLSPIKRAVLIRASIPVLRRMMLHRIERTQRCTVFADLLRDEIPSTPPEREALQDKVLLQKWSGIRAHASRDYNASGDNAVIAMQEFLEHGAYLSIKTWNSMSGLFNNVTTQYPSGLLDAEDTRVMVTHVFSFVEQNVRPIVAASAQP